MNILKKIYYNKYTKKSFSLSGVDLVVDRIFKNTLNGIYVDIGCNHPIKYNNTYKLHKKGWRGINVDLDDESIKQFNILRPKDHNICAVVSDKEEDTKIYFYHERSAINTISEDLQNSRNSKPAKTFCKKSLTLEQIIDHSVYASSKINLLSIDVENYEYNILKNFNFEKYKIDVIVVEIHDYKQEKLEIYNQSIEYVLNSNVYSLLTKNNYKMINWIQSDVIFVRNNFRL